MKTPIMDTPPLVRLTSLMRTNKFQAAPSTAQPTLAERELTAMAERSGKWKIPDAAQYPRKVQGPQPKPAAGRDIYTSSEDEDDYSAAFQRKPKMMSPSKKKKSQRQAPLTISEPKGFAHDSAQVPAEGAIAYLGDDHAAGLVTESENHGQVTRNLPDKDDQGNPATGHFCQFGLVGKFPYKYMVDENSRVSRHFFANQKFYERTWDLYYIHPPESSYSTRPMLLVPYHQVKTLIDQISTAFKIDVRVPSDPFTLSFFDDGTPEPVFLGTTMSRADINDLQDSVPAPPKGHGEPPHNCSKELDHSFAAFKAKMDRAQAAEKRKKAAIKKRKAEDRFLAIQDWCKQLRRVQRYLGVRPESFKFQAPPEGLSWQEQEVFTKEQEKKSGVTIDALNLNKPAPHDFKMAPIFISIDIESYERAHDIITEVGISTLDTLDLVDMSPGEGGEEWMRQIRSRHFRIKGREIYINKDFCIGDGDAFQFGDSEWVDAENIGDVIDSCFEWPFSVQFKHDGKLKFHSQTWVDIKSNEADTHDDEDKESMATVATRSSNNSFPIAGKGQNESSRSGCPQNPTASQKGPKERNILLVGHDISADLAYLSKLNSAVFSQPREAATMYPPATPSASSSEPRAVRGAHILSCILEALDTSTLYKVLHKEQNNRSLTSIMADIGRSAFYSHNGGNDARYTLEALIGLVIKSRLMEDEVEATRKKDAELSQDNAWEAEKERRVTEKMAAARAEVEEEVKAWEDARAAGTSPVGSLESLQKEVQAAVTMADFGDGAQEDGFTPFTKTLEATHAAQNKKKKSVVTKQREWEIKVRQEDGIEGPCDWAVGGNDGFGK